MEEVKKDAPAAKEGEENTKKQKEEETLDTFVPKEEPKSEQIAKDQRKRAEKAEAQAEALQMEIAKLKKSAMEGAKPIAELNDELKALASEFNVDETFVSKLVSTVRAATKSEIKEELEKDYTPKFAKIDYDRQVEQAEKKFEDLYSKSLSQMPEYGGLVNKDVIKTLAFNPANSKKTLPQIIEEIYGSAVKGRKSIESTHASRDPEKANIVNPKDEDWDKIENDPQTRKEWSEQTMNDLKGRL